MTSDIIPPKGGGNKHRLTKRQSLFVEEYVKDCNGVRAARAAGYSAKNPYTLAHALLDPKRFPLVVEAVDAALEAKRRDCRIEAIHLIEETAAIGFLQPKRMLAPDGSVMPLADMPDDVAAAIASINVTYGEQPDEDGAFTRVRHVDVKFHNKLDALKQLAVLLGLTRENNTTINNMVLVQQLASQVKEMSDNDLLASLGLACPKLPGDESGGPDSRGDTGNQGAHRPGGSPPPRPDPNGASPPATD